LDRRSTDIPSTCFLSIILDRTYQFRGLYYRLQVCKISSFLMSLFVAPVNGLLNLVCAASVHFLSASAPPPPKSCIPCHTAILAH
jgi:hypothetical protein